MLSEIHVISCEALSSHWCKWPGTYCQGLNRQPSQARPRELLNARASVWLCS